VPRSSRPDPTGFPADPTADSATDRPDESPADSSADPAACERQAVGLLTRREHSRLELERKLASRGHPPELIDATLTRLEQSGLLSGQRFMESFIESRAARGLGPVRIRAELMQRGIPSAAAAEAIAAAAKDWAALAAGVRGKRFGRGSPRDFKERARQTRFLEYRGFRGADIDAALELGDDSD
jgi:regulatory protein